MEDYFDLKEQMNEIKEKYIQKLNGITQEEGYKGTVAWFNFNKDNEFSIVWNLNHISLPLLNKLEKEFGKIKEITTTRFSENLTIIFRKESEK